MLFAAPISFSEALASRKVKALLPTTANSAELMNLSAALRERGSFSATIDRAEILQGLDDITSQIIEGDFTIAKGKTLMGEFLQDNGYTAALEDAGTIKDLTSDARKTVKLQTDTDMALGFGFFQQGQDPVLLDEYPCWELFRLEARKQPRDWINRWIAAGGKLYDGRMIARKDDPIWTRLGPFEQPYPPFDFNSGMWTRNVARQECIDLGVIEPDTQVQPQQREFNDGLQATPAVRSQALREAIVTEAGDQFFFDGDVLKLRPNVGGLN